MNENRDVILKIFDDYSNSVLFKDSNKLLNLYSNSLQIFDMWEVFSINHKDEWEASINTWFKSIKPNERVIVNFTSITLTIENLIAFASAFVSYKAIDNNDQIIRQMKNRITLNFRKENEIWKICHQHTSVPISGIDTKAIFI